MQIKFLNKILDGVKKENGKKEEKMESLNQSKNSSSQLLQEEKKDLQENMKDIPDKKQNSNIKQPRDIKNNSKKETDEITEDYSTPSSTQQDNEYVIPVIKESLRKKEVVKTEDISHYFSKKRKKIIEKYKKGRKEINKERMESNAGNKIHPEIDSNSNRFMLRESKLIKKGTEPMVFNPEGKIGTGKEGQAAKRDIKSKSQNDEIKKSAKRVDRDSTLFVISTLRRLIDEERFINAEAEPENIFSFSGKKSSKVKTPLTRSRVTAIKKRKTGTRHPKPDKKIVFNKLEPENYNIDKTVGKAEEIYKAYHLDWL